MAAQGQVPLFMIGQTVSHYRIVEKLGAGGMGEVYRAEDTRLGRSVALKVLSPQFGRDPQRRKRFQEEARAAAALTHPGIATVYQLEEVGDDLYLVFEYVRGETLRAVVNRGPLATDELVDVAVDIARALAAAHEYGIVHRDLKPENIIRTPDGETKILDFGLARFQPAALESSTAPTRLTEAGTILGTVAYMSPEQLEGKDADYRTDIFSFGVLLYELATGTHPFEGSTPASTIARIMTAEPVPVVQRNPLSPPELDRIVRKCLRKRPGERYQSTRDLAVDLEQLQRDTRAARLPGAAETDRVETSVWQRAFSLFAPSPRRWWQLNTLGVLFIYPLFIYFGWKVKGWTPGGWGVALFFAELACVAVAAALRMFLANIAWWNPARLPQEVRRVAPWLQYPNLALMVVLLVMAGRIATSHEDFAALLAGFAVVGVVAVLVVEPAIDRGAFPPAEARAVQVEPGLLRRAYAFAVLSPRRWWQLNNLVYIAVDALLIYVGWLGREVMLSARAPAGGLPLFFGVLVCAAISGTLRMYLWATSFSDPAALPAEIRRVEPWVRRTGVLLAIVLLIMAGVIAPMHDVLAGLLAGLAVVRMVASLVALPSITRRAFPSAQSGAVPPAERE